MDNVISLNRDFTNKKFLRAKDIQIIFGISRPTVDNWARYGYLTRHKVGRNIFYEENEVKKLQNMGI